jgi:hypothetical protein
MNAWAGSELNYIILENAGLLKKSSRPRKLMPPRHMFGIVADLRIQSPPRLHVGHGIKPIKHVFYYMQCGQAGKEAAINLSPCTCLTSRVLQTDTPASEACNVY